MNKEDREWLDKLIKENKESVNELTYTYCPFSVLYALQQENKELKRNCNIGNENLSFYRNENQQLHNKIKKVIEILKEHFLEEWVRSSDTSDGVGRMEIDTEHWTYKAYEILKDSDVNG